MTIEEKAKRYNEALKVLHKYDGANIMFSQSLKEEMFPELKESGDERTRKEIIIYLKSILSNKKYGDKFIEDWIDWLEKQSEQKEYTFKSLPRLLDMIDPTNKAKAYCQKLMDTLANEGYAIDAKIVGECLKQMNGEKVALATMDEKQGEQKPNYCHHEVDLSECSEEYRKAYYDGWNNCNMQHSQCKSELDDVVKCLINGMKFYYEDSEEATWGTDKWSMPVKHIIEVLEKRGEQKPCMIQWRGDNLKEVIDFTGKDKNFEKWFKSFEEYEKYVGDHNGIFKLFNADGSHYEIPVGAWIVKTPDGYNVASKAKYKQKSAWSEEDEKKLLCICAWIKDYPHIADFKDEMYTVANNYVNWLKSLRDRVSCEVNCTTAKDWSEEEIEKAAQEWDSKANFSPFYMTMDGDKPTGVKQDITTHKESFKAGVNWILESLKPQNTWKPSEEQMEALRKYSDNPILRNLYYNLKKLKV